MLCGSGLQRQQRRVGFPGEGGTQLRGSLRRVVRCPGSAGKGGFVQFAHAVERVDGRGDEQAGATVKDPERGLLRFMSHVRQQAGGR